MVVGYYEAWKRDHDWNCKLRARMRNDETLWQGKHAILRHENNQLRKKISRQHSNTNKEQKVKS